MDNAMVKRGIGAVVLAIIAALLLGYLLKDKSRERQEVVEMNLPGTASDSKIPSLSATTDNTATEVTDGANNLADKAGETTKNAGATVVAAAAGAGAAVATAANNTADKVKATAGQAVTSTSTGNANTMTRPGFSIRPAAPGEQRDAIDPGSPESAQKTNKNKKAVVANTKQQGTATNKNRNTVVASSAGTKNEAPYRPRLIKERKTRIVSSAQGSSHSSTTVRASKPVKHASDPASKSKSSSSSTTTKNASQGQYAIQLMATASKSRANKLAKTMKNEGYSSFITRTTRQNKVLYRVRVRAGKNRNTALAAQQKMKRRYKKNFFVQNSLVVSN